MEIINKIKGYIQSNRLACWTSFCSLFVGITVFLLCHHQCLAFGDERLNGNRLWKMASLSSFFYTFGGIVLLIPVTRQMGCFLLGCAVSCSSLLGIIFTFFPEYRSWGIIIVIFTGLTMVYMLWTSYVCALRDKERLKKLKLEHQEKIAQLTFQLDMQGKENVALKNKVTGQTNTNNELCGETKKKDRIIEVQNQTNINLRDELEINNRFCFESQLSSQLEIMVTGKSDSLPFAVNNFQGSYDRSLADIIGMTNGTFWMVELKREKRNLSTERNKFARKKQHELLKEEQNKSFRNIADKCHWMGCGIQTEKEATSIYFPYWPTFENGFPDNAIKLDEFTDRAFSDDNPVGVLFESFKRYTDFLLKCGEGNDAEIKDIPFLLFCKNKNGKFRSIKTDLHAVNECIKKLELKKTKKLEMEKTKGIQINKQKDKGMEHSR